MNATAFKGRKHDDITNEGKYVNLHVQEDGSYGENLPVELIHESTYLMLFLQLVEVTSLGVINILIF
jgi:hypothetical protein